MGTFTSEIIRAVCDTGSQVNLIAESVVKKGSLPTMQCCIRVGGVFNEPSHPVTKRVRCQLLAAKNDTSIGEVELLVVYKFLTSTLPGTKVSIELTPDLLRPDLADPDFDVPASVEILLGAGVWALITQEDSLMVNGGVMAQKSKLGWLLYGGGVRAPEKAHTLAIAECSKDDKLAEMLQKFWELEEIPTKRTRSVEQEECEEFFIRHHYRLPTGRYVVGIPLRSNVVELGTSREIALRRFYGLEKRFEQNKDFRDKYVAGMNEMLQAGHLQEVDRKPNGWCYYIPHHAVQHKFRIVFDGSCPTNLGISLNDVQLVGEKLQDDLFDLIMRFRTHRIAITADIKKMYLQVEVLESQWDLQRIFWRDHPNNKLKEYWLKKVTFGMASAPHCAVRAMIQCARDHEVEFSRAAKVIQNDFYMDDCLTGADKIEEAQSLCTDMKTVLGNGGFILDKWYSNESQVLPNSATQSRDGIPLGGTTEPNVTVLGLKWLHDSDELAFNFRPREPEEVQKLTMRDIFSQSAQIFDPNGLIGPATVVSKIFMQRLHKLKIGWDVPITPDVGLEWLSWQKQLSELTAIRIPRWFGITQEHDYVLHGFADASELAYGAVIYIQVGSRCSLVASRSKVAPIKTCTIPRLELCAAVLLSKLMNSAKRACHFKNVRTVLWSDSSIVLHWLTKDPDMLKPFVHNRIQIIRRSTVACEWRHVPSLDNPADCLSRGIMPNELKYEKNWWNGPEWLNEQEDKWPAARPDLTVNIEQEIRAEIKSNWLDMAGNKKLRPILCGLVDTTVFEMRSENNVKSDVLTRTSKWRRLIRRTAWLWRFYKNCRLRGDDSLRREFGDITTEEEELALESWVKREQFKYYSIEIIALQKQDNFPRKSQITKLYPVIDGRGLMRVGGRLENATLPYDQKHPIILPGVGHLAQLLIKEAHKETLHGGFQLVAATIRQRFWIVNLRREVRSHIFRCVSCVRQKQQVCEQLMGVLPVDRVRQSAPFSHTGVDYAGPFEVKARGGRCRILEKKYVAVFVCMATKAVHLELVEDLSTPAFIAAFLRFTGVRGACTNLWSDNGTAFVGAEKELSAMVHSWSQMDSDAFKELRELRVKWNFITPSAPHQGGLWESAVKSMKYHLRRVVGQQKLTSTDFHTLLAQISAVLNSRPITALTDDPEDLDFLSPGHLTVGRPLKQLFGERMTEAPKNALRRYKITQQMSQAFWKKWHQEYLHGLQQRPKWVTKKENLKVNDLVLIKEDNTAPTFWKTGRIMQILPGADGLVRNVELRVAGKKRKILRPVQKLVFLPLEPFEEYKDSSRGDCTIAAVVTTDNHSHSHKCGPSRIWCEFTKNYMCNERDGSVRD